MCFDSMHWLQGWLSRKLIACLPRLIDFASLYEYGESNDMRHGCIFIVESGDISVPRLACWSIWCQKGAYVHIFACFSIFTSKMCLNYFLILNWILCCQFQFKMDVFGMRFLRKFPFENSAASTISTARPPGNRDPAHSEL